MGMTERWLTGIWAVGAFAVFLAIGYAVWPLYHWAVFWVIAAFSFGFVVRGLVPRRSS